MKKILFAAVAAICASCVLSASADDYVRIKSADANSYHWVDTGVNGGTDLAFDMSFNTGVYSGTSNHALLGGAWGSTYSKGTYTLALRSGHLFFYGTAIQVKGTPGLNTDLRVVITTNATDNSTCYFASGHYITTQSLACGNPEPLTLFADSQHERRSKMKLYRCKMTKAGVLVRDFAAVSNTTTGVVGLYDFSGTSADPFYPGGHTSGAAGLAGGEIVPFSAEIADGGSSANGQRTVIWSADGFRLGATVTAKAVLSTSSDYSGATTVLNETLAFDDQLDEKILNLTGLTPNTRYYLKLTVSDDQSNEIVKELSFVATGAADVYPGGDLQAALAAARAAIAGGAESATVRVAPGSYDITATLELDKKITLLGIGGPEATFINQKTRTISKALAPQRVVSLSSAGARVEGLTLTIPIYNWSEQVSYNGGAILMTADAFVTNCIVRGPGSGFDTLFGGQNRSLNGSGIYMTAGRVVDTLVTDIRSGSHGAGVYLTGGTFANSEVKNCCGGQFVNPHTGGMGGGIRLDGANAVVTNVFVHDCQTTFYPGAGVYISKGLLVDSRINGCTNVLYGTQQHANVDGIGVFQTGGTVKNCVIAGNRMLNGDPSDYWYKTTPAITGSQMETYVSGAGNVPRAPVFADAANGDWTIEKSFTASALDVLPGTSVTFEAEETDGSDYSWDFGDGGSATGASATHTFAAMGRYDVTLRYKTAKNKSVERTRSAYIRVYSSSGKVYVRAEGGAGTFPYDEESKATSDFWSAVEAARRETEAGVTQATVDVGEGQFQTWHFPILDGPIAVIGAGDGKTVITNGVDTKMVRPLELAHPNALVSGLSISCNFDMSSGYGGIYGVAALVSAGTVTNCVIENVVGGGQNWICYGSLALRGGTLVDSVIRNNNVGAYGNGLYMDGTALADRCVITNNANGRNQYSSKEGQGAYVAGSAALRNSLIADNRSDYYYGAGVYLNSSKAVVENCTIVNNTVSSGGLAGAGAYVNAGTLRNSIVRENLLAETSSDVVKSTSQYATVEYTCSSEIIAGTGNTQSAPAFVDAENGDYHLAQGSVGIDIGYNTAAALAGLDLDRATRVRDGSGGGQEIVDMGCYEFTLGGTGLSATFNITGPAGGVGSLTTSFGAVVILNGAVLSDYTGCTFHWDFGDGTVLEGEGADYASASHTYTGGQKRSVSLTVTRGGVTTDPFVREDCVAVYVDHVYVANNGSATFPYDTPAKATPALGDAYDELVLAAANGATRCRLDVGEGTFTAAKTLAFTFPCEIVGKGPDVSTFSSGVPENTFLKLAADGSVLSGLTLRDAKSGNAAGGAVAMTSDSLVTNCVMTKNDSSGHGRLGIGGAIYATKGRIIDCKMINNDVSWYNSTVALAGTVLMERCVITDNHGGNKDHAYGGAGLYLQSGYSTNRNCLIARNCNNDRYGAGVYHASGHHRLENCTIVDNVVLGTAVVPECRDQPAGVYMANSGETTLLNCIVNFNTNKNSSGEMALANIGDPTVAPYTHVTYSAAPELTSGEGNVAIDATFMDRANGDYHITREFTAAARGQKQDWMATAFDLDHQPRLRGHRVDLGCYIGISPGFLLLLK